MSISDELTGAMAALAKAGMAFTTNVDSDGKQVYIVDSVALAEEEIILLHRNGALTLDGIQCYRTSHSIGRAGGSDISYPVCDFFPVSASSRTAQ